MKYILLLGMFLGILKTISAQNSNIPYCEAFQIINKPLIKGNVNYEASSFITASSSVKIEEGFVTFKAGETIELTEGFQIIPNKNTYFKAYIQDCEKQKGTATMLEEIAESTVMEGFSLSAYPNPMNEKVTIEYELPQNEQVTLVLYDIQGAKVRELLRESPLEKGKYAQEYEIRELANGVYLLHLQTTKGLKIIKLVKE